MGARATWICARATKRGARASDVYKGHIFCLYTKKDKQCNLVQGPQLEVQALFKVLENPEDLAPLFVALARGPCTSSRGSFTGPCT